MPQQKLLADNHPLNSSQFESVQNISLINIDYILNMLDEGVIIFNRKFNMISNNINKNQTAYKSTKIFEFLSCMNHDPTKHIHIDQIFNKFLEIFFTCDHQCLKLIIEIYHYTIK